MTARNLRNRAANGPGVLPGLAPAPGQNHFLDSATPTQFTLKCWLSIMWVGVTFVQTADVKGSLVMLPVYTVKCEPDPLWFLLVPTRFFCSILFFTQFPFFLSIKPQVCFDNFWRLKHKTSSGDISVYEFPFIVRPYSTGFDFILLCVNWTLLWVHCVLSYIVTGTGDPVWEWIVTRE